ADAAAASPAAPADARVSPLREQLAGCGRTQWILGGALAAFVVGFALFGYRPAAQRLATLAMEIESKERSLAADEVNARKLPVVALEVEKLRARLERFDKKLPNQQELGPFIGDITQASQAATLRRLTVQPGVAKRGELFSELPISLNFEGDFLSVFSFLQQTEGMQRLTRIRSLAVRSKDTKLGTVDVQVSMNIYFSEE
ncbi:MAG TPA: type 4a pilus biogenesis protein PilO, partial [Tepidisphaeraceae bacterium]|nr:type 4a pilus biogenesis protein PilO [Tepidisphaeraceae bacterium]